MLAGISTACFYPELTEYALTCIANTRAQAAEVFFNAPSELKDPYLGELRKIADGGGTRVVSVHPYTSGLEPLFFFTDYKRRYQDGLEIYKRYFHAANVLGADILVFHGDRRESRIPLARCFDIFGEIMQVGKSMGVTVAHENVPRCAGWQPAFFKQLREYLPQARFVLDVKQCIRSQCSTEEMLKAMGKNLIHVHISDRDDTHDCLPIGMGTWNLPFFLKQLRAVEFDGAVLLEVYRESYEQYAELYESLRILESAIKDG